MRIEQNIRRFQIPVDDVPRVCVLNCLSNTPDEFGRLLKFAQAIESADESSIGFMQTNMHLPAVQVYDAYNEAYDWMVEVESQSTAMA